MESTLKALTVEEVKARIARGETVLVHPWGLLTEGYLRDQREIIAIDTTCGMPFVSQQGYYRSVAERQFSFGKCPSKHGWHNPENVSPEKIREQARARWGEDPNPYSVRLLARDEIGAGRCLGGLPSIGLNSGSPGDNSSGAVKGYTYFTTVPYGELPPPGRYAFPECAPYGYSRATGRKIEAPEGYRLLHVGTYVPAGTDLWTFGAPGNAAIYNDTDGKAYTARVPFTIAHERADAIFVKTGPTEAELDAAESGAVQFYGRLYALARRLQPGKIPGGESAVWWCRGTETWRQTHTATGEPTGLFHTSDAADKATEIMNEEGWRLPAGIGKDTSED